MLCALTPVIHALLRGSIFPPLVTWLALSGTPILEGGFVKLTSKTVTKRNACLGLELLVVRAEPKPQATEEPKPPLHPPNLVGLHHKTVTSWCLRCFPTPPPQRPPPPPIKTAGLKYP